MTAGSAGQIEHRLNVPSAHVRRDKVNCPLGLGLVAVLIDPEIVLSEPLLEPIRFLRPEVLHQSGFVIQNDHL